MHLSHHQTCVVASLLPGADQLISNQFGSDTGARRKPNSARDSILASIHNNTHQDKCSRNKGTGKLCRQLLRLLHDGPIENNSIV
jgi:hypothetical protein